MSSAALGLRFTPANDESAAGGHGEIDAIHARRPRAQHAAAHGDNLESRQLAPLGSHIRFPSRVDYLGHLCARQYARLVDEWVSTGGLDRRE